MYVHAFWEQDKGKQLWQAITSHQGVPLSGHAANTNDYTHMPNTFKDVVKCKSNQCKPGYLIAVQPQVKRQQLPRFR